MYIRGPGIPQVRSAHFPLLFTSIFRAFWAHCRCEMTDQGVVSKLPTTHLDIVATILELTGNTAGPATPSNLDGLSFAAVRSCLLFG